MNGSEPKETKATSQLLPFSSAGFSPAGVLPLNQIICGHAPTALRSFPDELFNCIITSVPYWGLRDYGLEPQIWGGSAMCEHEWVAVSNPNGNGTDTSFRRDREAWFERGGLQSSFCTRCNAWLGSYGLEPNPELYVDHTVEIFGEARRGDAVLIDVRHRWIRGYEIKINRQDFLQDNKWTEYSEFCSSVCIVCPSELIRPDEVKKPFGLIWMNPDPRGFMAVKYKRKPANIQRRDSLAWLWMYVSVLETEFPRLIWELESLHHRAGVMQERLNQYFDKSGDGR